MCDICSVVKGGGMLWVRLLFRDIADATVAVD